MTIAARLLDLAFVAGGNPLSHVLPHPIYQEEADLGFFTQEGVITVLSDQILTMIVGGLLLMLVFAPLVRKRRGDGEVDGLVPTGFSNAIEAICHYLREEVARPAMGPYTDRFIKYIWTAFFFILTMNLLGLIPVSSVGKLFGVYIGGTPTTNIWITGTLAFITFGMMVINGLRLGGKAYLAHFSPGPLWMAPIMIPVEIIGTIAKACALALRLFAAMSAGHILMTVLVSLILMAGQGLGAVGGFGIGAVVVAGSVAITMVEIFVAFLQAFIFTYLSALFIGQSVNLHHDH
ncbi:MAG: F0F1 ATP synthase subunit A [Acidobacteriota bacterium]